jgi:hypothetical protein
VLDEIDSSNLLTELLTAVKTMILKFFTAFLSTFAPLFALIMRLVAGGGGGPQDNNDDGFSDEFKELVFDMMSFDYKLRPSLQEIREHPWMKIREAP